MTALRTSRIDSLPIAACAALAGLFTQPASAAHSRVGDDFVASCVIRDEILDDKFPATHRRDIERRLFFAIWLVDVGTLSSAKPRGLYVSLGALEHDI